MILPGRPVVLCYHAVSASWAHVLALPPDQLLRQVRSILWRGYRGATAYETLEGRGRLLHVTFDDAFRNIVPVLPELKRLRIPVTVFACSGYADTGAPLTLPELATDDRADLDGLATMTWDELRALVEDGVEVGSHTISHPHLPALSAAELRRELRESRERIEEKLQLQCRLAAYPYGEHDRRVRTAAQEAGYESAFALDAAPGDRYAVPRVDLFHSEGLARTVVKTMPRVRRVARWLSGIRTDSPRRLDVT